MVLAIDTVDGRGLSNKAGLNRRIKFVCVAMCSLVMSLCSRDVFKYVLLQYNEYIE